MCQLTGTKRFQWRTAAVCGCSRSSGDRRERLPASHINSDEGNLQLEKLRLKKIQVQLEKLSVEVKRLRAEEQKREPLQLQTRQPDTSEPTSSGGGTGGGTGGATGGGTGGAAGGGTTGGTGATSGGATGGGTGATGGGTDQEEEHEHQPAESQQRDFECTCKPQVFDCNLYLVLPVFIIFLFILWTDRSFQTVCRFLISDAGRLHTFSFWGSFFRHIVKAAFIGLLWVVVVLVDGSWYVCCQNDLSEQQAQIPCRSTGRISEEERVIIAELKNKSRVIGSFLLFGIVCVPALVSSCGPRKCWRRKLYGKLILEEEENVLKEILRKSAKDQLTREVKEKICGDQWDECFNAAAELIEASRPDVREQDEQLQRRAGAADNLSGNIVSLSEASTRSS